MVNREGVSTFSAVSAFLGSIFFTALIILFQSPDAFKQSLLDLKINETLSIVITQRLIIAFPLMITIVLFIYSAFFFAIACCRDAQEDCSMLTDVAITPFLVGFLSIFVSLFVVLAFIEVIVAVVFVLISICLVLW
ncbi:MAG: hypothetical protein NWE96_03345 [Candidatus Bathyarchaeota archaeon]|nr:hypothetical protein [Candidatus Bathyarchaeota archaeon]